MTPTSMTTSLASTTRAYLLSLIFSILFAVAGFSYNVWRMEVTEENSNIRTACFEMLLVLAELEQSVYAAHYDHNLLEGNPRKGWVRVGLVSDLGMLTTEEVVTSADALKQVWSEHWALIPENRTSADAVVAAIDHVRVNIKQVLASLQ